MRSLNLPLIIFCSLSSSLFAENAPENASDNAPESEQSSEYELQLERLEKENRLTEAELKKRSGFQ